MNQPRAGRVPRSWRWVGAVGLGLGLGLALILALRHGPGRRLPEPGPSTWNGILAAVEANQWERASTGLVHWLQARPDDNAAWLMLARVEEQRGRLDSALRALGNVRAPAPALAQALALTTGEIQLKRHQAAEAERAFRAAADQGPNAIAPRRRLVFLYTLQRRTEAARAVAWDIYRATRAWRDLVTVAGLITVPPEADPSSFNAERDEFLAAAPRDPWLVRARGLARFYMGRPAEAMPDLERAAPAITNDPEGRLALAECRVALGAKDDIDSIVGPLPESPADQARWWRIRGNWHQANGNLDQAISDWSQAIATNGQDRASLYLLGRARSEQGKTAEAGELLARAEAIREREAAFQVQINRLIRHQVNAPAFERLGTLCADAGFIPLARAWFEQAIQLDPLRSSAQAALASLPTPSEAPSIPPRLVRDQVAPQKAAGPEAPRLTSPIRFEDVTESAGLAFRYESGASERLALADTMGGGVGLIDYDRDGFLDVYFVNGCALPIDPKTPPTPNRLFRNRGDGTFEDVTERASVAGRGYGMGCVVGDYDNDGFDDLFVTGLGQTVLYRNRGDGTFEDVTERAGVGSTRWTTAAGFGDLDGDADLDLVVVTYVAAVHETDSGCKDATGRRIHCPPSQFDSEADHLFRNNGDGTFTDVWAAPDADQPRGPGLGLAIADFDDDGKLDLFIANDAAPDYLFHNLGHLTFEEIGALAGAAYDGAGRATASMGVVAEDLNADARIDLFHTNFIHEANTLLRNEGRHFRDATVESGLDAPSRGLTGFGTVAPDFDRDGFPDLFIANGHVDDQPWLGLHMAQRQQIMAGGPDGRFTDVSESAAPYFRRRLVGRGAAAGDLDNDGRVDLVIVHRDAPAVLLRNTTAAGHGLGLRLRGTRSGNTPIGAEVVYHVGGTARTRWITSGTSYLSQNDPRLWLGLGTASSVDRVEVRWPSGLVEEWANLPADHIIELVEGTAPATAASRVDQP